MIVSSGTPQQVFDWFQEVDEQHELLCLFLACSKADQQQVADFVSNYCSMDVAMGDKVGFILFSPELDMPLGAVRGRERMIVFPGQLLSDERETRVPIPLGETFRKLKLDDVKLGEKYAEVIAEQTAVFVPALMSLLNVSYEALPAMCVVVKGYNECRILTLGSTWKSELIINWLRKLASIVESGNSRIWPREIYEPLVERARPVLQSMKDLDISLGTKTLTLADSFDRFCKAAHCSMEDQIQIANFLQRRSFSMGTLESLLLHLGLDSSQCFQEFGQLRKIRRIILEIEGIASRLAKELEELEPPPTLITLFEELELRRNEIHRQLNSASFRGTQSIHIPLPKSTTLGTFTAMATFFTKWAGVIAKLPGAIEWVKHLPT